MLDRPKFEIVEAYHKEHEMNVGLHKRIVALEELVREAHALLEAASGESTTGPSSTRYEIWKRQVHDL